MRHFTFTILSRSVFVKGLHCKPSLRGLLWGLVLRSRGQGQGGWGPGQLARRTHRRWTWHWVAEWINKIGRLSVLSVRKAWKWWFSRVRVVLVCVAQRIYVRVGFLFICAVRVLEINNVSYPFFIFGARGDLCRVSSAKLMLSWLLNFFMSWLMNCFYWKAHLIYYPLTKEVDMRAQTHCPSVCTCSSEWI